MEKENNSSSQKRKRLIDELFQKKRMKILGIFFLPLAFYLEIPIRNNIHFLSAFLLNLTKEYFVSGTAIYILKEFLIQSSPISFIYFPAMIYLIISIKDGFQKFDWILAPFLMGIIFKGGIYGIISLNQKSGEFWELLKLGTPQIILQFIIGLIFFIFIWALIVWIENFLEE